MVFGWEYHLLVVEQMRNLRNPYVGEVPNLVLLDTSTLTGSPTIARQACDPRHCDARVRAMAEAAGHSNFSGMMGQDVPFFPDPFQSLRFVVLLQKRYFGQGSGICIVRSETLLRLARGVRRVHCRTGHG